jgi:hypothetical protein
MEEGVAGGVGGKVSEAVSFYSLLHPFLSVASFLSQQNQQ